MKKLLLVIGAVYDKEGKFQGAKRSGKSSFAKILTEKKESVRIMSIAEPIKRFAAKILGITYEQLEEMKDDAVVEVKDKSGNIISSVLLRHIIEQVGNDLTGGEFGIKYHWCKQTYKAMQESDKEYVVIDDVRGEHEVDYFKTHNAGREVIVVRLVRNGYEDENQSHHWTNRETLIIPHDFEVVASNLDELEQNTDLFLSKIS